MNKLTAVLGVLLIASGLFLSGCHTETVEGFGRDVQKVGQKIED